MDIVRVLFGIFVASAGVGHFAAPRYFASLVPPWVPDPRRVVLLSGVADVVVGTAILVPATSAAGSWAACGLIGTYLVGHVEATRRVDRDGPLLRRPLGLALRIVANSGYVAMAVTLAVRAG